MDDWACLENRCGRKVTVGSNPTLSATKTVGYAPGSLLLSRCRSGQPAAGQYNLRDGRKDESMKSPILSGLALMTALLLGACASPLATPAEPASTAESAVTTIINVSNTSSQTILAQQAVPTATPGPMPTPLSSDTRADVSVWWPAEIYPAVDTPAYDVLTAQLDNFGSTSEMTLQVRQRRLEGPGGIMSTLRTASLVASSALPDLVLLPREDMIVAAEAGLIFPVDGQTPPAIVANLFPQAVKFGMVEETLYGVPYTLQVQHIVYRETVFDSPPSSLEAILESGQPFAFTAAPSSGISETLLIQYMTSGGRVASDDGRPMLTETALLDTLTFYETAVETGLTGPNALTHQSPANYWDSFLSGAISLVQTDSDTYLKARAQIPSVTAGPIPTAGDKAATTLHGWMWVLTTPDPDRQAQAIDFLAWILRAEHQAEFTEAVGTLPSQRPALRIWEDSNYTELIDRLLTGTDTVIAPDVNAAAASALQNSLAAVLSGEQSAEEAAAAALVALQ